jgi:hypothetical protein
MKLQYSLSDNSYFTARGLRGIAAMAGPAFKAAPLGVLDRLGNPAEAETMYPT